MTSNTQLPPADAGRLDRRVRPVAYRLRDADAQSWLYYSAEELHAAAKEALEPLYDRAALDSAVAAEREHIRARLLAMDDAVQSRHNYYAHAAVVLFGPNVRAKPGATVLRCDSA